MASDLELLELLAHLDFVIAEQSEWSPRDGRQQQHIDTVLHKVSKELQKTRSIHFKVPVIEKRLWSEFAQLRKYTEELWPMVFRNGSEEFKHLSNAQRKAIQDRQSHIRLLRLVRGDHTARRLRSQAVARPSPTQGITTRRTASEDRVRRCTTRDSTISQKPASKIQPRKPKSTLRRTPESSSGSNKKANSPLAIPSIEIEETPVSSPSSDNSKDISDVYSPRVSVGKGHDWALKDCGNRSPGANTVFTVISAESYACTTSELAYFKQAYQKSQEEVKNLEDEKRRIYSRLQEDHGVQSQRLKEWRTEIKEVQGLKSQVERLRGLQPFLRPGSPPGKETVLDKISRCLKDLQGYLSAFLFAENTTKALLTSLDGRSQDLDSLLLLVFKTDEQATLKSTLKVVSPVTIQEIAQALLGASIYCWIFRERFKLPGMVVTPLLQQYRDHIADLAGKESLSNLDLAVHDSMIAERSFEDENVPYMAKAMAIRFLRVLAIFYKDSNTDSREALQIDTENIFRYAIELRGYSLIAGSDFILQYPSPKDTFVGAEMEMLHPTEPETNSDVKLIIFPGIHVYDKEKDMVTYEGFKNTVGGNRKPRHVFKALVIC
ncbi:hypothetical protein DM02DRAFT_728323, partial [Periconia macrospinosa]